MELGGIAPLQLGGSAPLQLGGIAPLELGGIVFFIAEPEASLPPIPWLLAASLLQLQSLGLPRMQDAQDAGCRMQDAGCRMQDAGCTPSPPWLCRMHSQGLAQDAPPIGLPPILLCCCCHCISHAHFCGPPMRCCETRPAPNIAKALFAAKQGRPPGLGQASKGGLARLVRLSYRSPFPSEVRPPIIVAHESIESNGVSRRDSKSTLVRLSYRSP